MIMTDGGIRMPSVPPAVMTPEASFTSYPALSMGLNAMTPISTTTAPTRPLIVCTFWGIASGLVGAGVVLMGVIAFNPMLKAGFEGKIASGAITAGAPLG